MADDHDERQRDSFHWPPTSEELESIQVIEVHEDTPPPPARRSRWHRLIDGSVIAQAGLAFASLASIGIAITSLLAPAQPSARVSKRDAAAPPSPIIASATVPVATAPAPATPASTSFQHMVTFEPPPPSVAEVHAERAARTSALVVPQRQSVSQTPQTRKSRAVTKVRAARPPQTDRVARRGEAGQDPVSRFAVHTGLSVWKAMRAVGRSFKRDPDDEWSTRSAGGRRTAAAVNLAADDAPSAR